MLHEPSNSPIPPGQQSQNATMIKEVVGKWLFILYAFFYFGFIFLNLASPSFMGTYVGVFNIAIIYGFGLILFAIFLAFAYNHISTRAESMADETPESSAAEVEAHKKED